MASQERIPVRDRTQLEAMIADLSTGIMMVDTDGTLLYANRTALQMHGVQELSSLGKSSSGYQEAFLLTDLEGVPLLPKAYPLERLLNGETFTDLNVMVPVRDDTLVHKCRGLAVEDEGGQLDFFALFIEDETEQYDAEQRFERTFSANPAPAIINRLSDLRYIKVNRGFLEMTGFRREEVIGRTAYEFDVLAGVESREMALKQFHQGQTIAPLESYLSVRSGGTKFVVVGGQPLEVNNEPCMLLTFIDLDERKRAEDALRQSEERFAKAFDLAPVASVISAAKTGRIFNTNHAFKALTGHGSGAAIGRTSAELGLWRSEGEKTIAELLKTSRHYRDLELKLYTKAGHVCDVLASAETIVINDEACVLWMFHDVTEWKRNEAELVEAVNLVMKDPDWFSSSVAKQLLAVKGRKPSQEASTKLNMLTKREQQVFTFVCQGLNGPKIAAELDVAANTVRNYMSGIYRKLELHSRAELVVWAKRHDVIT